MERIKVIHKEEEYLSALQRVREIGDPEVGTPDYDEAELLTLLLIKYEEENYPVDALDPVDFLKVRMEVLGLSQNDLVPYLGDKGTVSKVLNRTRPLSLQHIRSLWKGLGLPAEVLLA